MTVLPIVRRELRSAARRDATYWVRGVAALAALGAGTWIYLITSRGSPREAGMALFVTVTVLINFYALLAGLRTTADCLSEEKREGTLGLLFLTDLRGHDVVLGKLAATSLNSFYAMLAMCPVLGISLLLGGVTPGEFGRVSLASINNLLFSLAAGMFCSSVVCDDRKAIGTTFLLVAGLAALPLVGLFITVAAHQPTWRTQPAFLLPSPAYTCYAAFDSSFRSAGNGRPFWISLGMVHGLTWVLLALACAIVPRTWQDRPGTAGATSLSTRRRRWQYSGPQRRRKLRDRLLNLNPVLWLASRERSRTAFVYGTLAVLAVLWALGRLRFGRGWGLAPGIPFALAAHVLLKSFLATEGCRRFCEDRRSGALELLLATPLSVAEIVRGQRWALWEVFWGPTFVVLVADALLMLAGLGEMHNDESSWVAVWVVGMIMLVWDLHALSWIGPWLGLSSRTPQRAAAGAVTRICVLPWVVFAGGTAVLVLFLRFGNGSSYGAEPGWGFFLFAWFLISAAINLLFASRAAYRLRTGFREIATQRFDASPRYGEWGRVLGEWLRHWR